MIRTILVLASCLFLGSLSASAAPVSQVDYEPRKTAEITRFSTGAGGPLRIPTERLEKMTIIGGKGLSFLYPNQAHFYVETVTAEQAGYPDADMRQWPVYVFGLKDGTESSNPFIRDLLKTKRFGVDKQINPDVVRVFSTSTGKGFWAFGEEKSLIVLTEEDNRSSITLINVTGLPEETIKDMIIKGVI